MCTAPATMRTIQTHQQTPFVAEIFLSLLLYVALSYSTIKKRIPCIHTPPF